MVDDMKILYLPNEYSQQRQFEKKAWVYPVRMAMEAQKDINDGHEVFWNNFGPWQRKDGYVIGEMETDIIDECIKKPRYTDFLSLPFPDRKFTMAFDKRYQLYGNYKYHPATHIQVADGCWHGKCTFCVERNNVWKIRPIEHVMEEIDECHRLGFKELFDDSGTFPDGKWLADFCIKMICKPYKI